jgi:hypothetical protein
MLLATQVRTQTWWWANRNRIIEHLREDRGDVYSGTIFLAIAVVIAIAVGGILLVKFQTKAQQIDTNTPVAP